MPKELEFDTVNKLYLELSQVATATTGKELALRKAAELMRDEIITLVNFITREDGEIATPRQNDIARLKAATNSYDTVLKNLDS